MLAAHFIAYILLLHGWYAVPVPKPLQWEVIGDPPPCSAQSEPCPFAHVLPPIAVPQQSQQFDLPAVQQPSKESPNGPECLMSPCGHALTKWCHGGGWIGDMHIEEECSDHPPMVDGCADPRRVLLTSEDGKHHCVLLEAWLKPTSDKCWHYAYMQPVDAQGTPDGEQVAVRICEEEK